jgi:hypothetical protein
MKVAMADLPSADHIELFSCEIYDESRYPDHELIWLSSDEEAPTLAQTAASFESLPLVRRAIRAPEAMASDCHAEDPFVIPDSAPYPSNNTEVRLLPRSSSEGCGSAGILFVNTAEL